MAEKAIVFLCRNREEKKPEHNSEIKYPDAVIRKKEPAWSWVRFMSVNMVGKRGERMIRMVKFIKNMDVRKNRGKSCDLMVSVSCVSETVSNLFSKGQTSHLYGYLKKVAGLKGRFPKLAPQFDCLCFLKYLD